MLLFHDVAKFADDLGVLIGHIRCLGRVRSQIIEFNFTGPLSLGIRAQIHVQSDRFPVVDTNGLLPTVSRRLAIEERTRLLLLAQQGWCEADAIKITWRRFPGTDQFEQCRQPIFETCHAV